VARFPGGTRCDRSRRGGLKGRRRPLRHPFRVRSGNETPPSQGCTPGSVPAPRVPRGLAASGAEKILLEEMFQACKDHGLLQARAPREWRGRACRGSAASACGGAGTSVWPKRGCSTWRRRRSTSTGSRTGWEAPRVRRRGGRDSCGGLADRNSPTISNATHAPEPRMNRAGGPGLGRHAAADGTPAGIHPGRCGGLAVSAGGRVS
jgi:hypothetical protein